MNKRESMDFLRKTSVNCIEVLHFIETVCQNNNQPLKNLGILHDAEHELIDYKAKCNEYLDKWQTLEFRCRILIAYLRKYCKVVKLDDELVRTCEKILAGKIVY